MITACTLAIASAALLPHAEIAERPVQDTPQVMIEIQLRRAQLEGGMDAVRSSVQNASGVVPRGSIGGPAIYIGSSVIFETRMSYVETVSSPRILTLEGQEAEIIIGEQVTYIELDAEEELQLIEMEGVYEGLRIAMNPDVRDGGQIDFSTFEVTLSEVIGRVDIGSSVAQGSLPIAGGRPVVRSVTYAMPLTIEPAEEDEDNNARDTGGKADIVFATEDDDASVFWMTVTARVVEEE